MKINIATVFSGIGSVEWALKRMNIENEVIFACDNGDIELNFTDIEKVRNEIKSLDSIQEQKKFIDDFFSKTRKTNFVKKAYLANHKLDESFYFQDVRLIDGTKFKGKVDLFVGGSPCQSFSTVGKQLGLEDARGTLFYDYARLIDEIQPKVFIYENVKGLLNHERGKTWKTIEQVFHSINYNIIGPILMDAKEFGIPQTRSRIFVVGFKDNYTMEFPQKKETKFTLQDFLIENVSEGNYTIDKNGEILIKKKPGYINEKYYLSEKVRKVVMSSGTKNYYTKPVIDLTIARPLLSTMHKMHRAGVDNYVTTNGKIRKLTPRECLRLMGYDDSFKISVSDLQTYRQAGNSIVVDVMMSLLNAIIKTNVFKE